MYRIVVYGDHDPLLVVSAEYETLEEAEEAREQMWISIEEEEE